MHKTINKPERKIYMLWKILLVLATAISILLYLVILGANKSKTIEEREEEDYLQMVAVSKRQKGKEDEKTNNCRETECCKRINEMFEKMYKD